MDLRGTRQGGRAEGQVRGPVGEEDQERALLGGHLHDPPEPQGGACHARAVRPELRGGRASTSARKKKVRRLWGDGKGRFRTKGRYAASTVRGTKWLTEDRCGFTVVKVARGRVAVRDLVRKRTRVVRAGRSLTVRR
jgi:hypothetical protein